MDGTRGQGRLIVLEGTEGCGKTTQLKHAHAWLIRQIQAKGVTVPVEMTREPGGTLLCQSIRHVLLNPSVSKDEPLADRAELLLYAADRAQHVSGFLMPHLDRGTLILCDRYTDSTMAYQGYGRGLDRALIDQLNAIATQGLTSDLTLWLDLPVEIGLERMQKRGVADRLEQATVAFHHRVYQGFAELAATNPQRIRRIDASGTEAEVADRIQAVLQASLAQWFSPGA